MWNSEAQKCLMDGGDAARAGMAEKAEALLRRAYHLYKPHELGRLTASVLLGALLRKRGDGSGAMEWLEKSIPVPASFNELRTLFRAEVRNAKRARDVAAIVLWSNRMLSLAWIINGLAPHAPKGIEAEIPVWKEWERGLRSQNGTIYVWNYADHGAVPDSSFMNQQDIKTLHRAIFGE